MKSNVMCHDDSDQHTQCVTALFFRSYVFFALAVSYFDSLFILIWPTKKMSFFLKKMSVTVTLNHVQLKYIQIGTQWATAPDLFLQFSDPFFI